MNTAQKVGVVLRRHRYKKKMDQIDVAVAAEIDRSYISQIENGKVKVSVDAFIRLCDALEVPSWEILKEALTTKR